MISPLAYIHPEAKIGENVEIGPFCYIDRGVEIGDNNTLMNSVTILYGARIGSGNIFFPGSVIGAIPQDLKFRGEETICVIGDKNKIREYVTINRGTASKGQTLVGSGNLLMEGCHIAHDDIIGNDIIIGNCTKLAGEVTIDDHAILSACVLVHQFCRIGSYTMIGGGTRFSQNIVPYSITAREPALYCGLNIVGRIVGKNVFVKRQDPVSVAIDVAGGDNHRIGHIRVERIAEGERLAVSGVFRRSRIQ